MMDKNKPFSPCHVYFTFHSRRYDDLDSERQTSSASEARRVVTHGGLGRLFILFFQFSRSCFSYPNKPLVSGY